MVGVPLGLTLLGLAGFVLASGMGLNGGSILLAATLTLVPGVLGLRRGDASQIWRVPAAGGVAVQVTRSEASQALETADGTCLYFVRSWDSPGLWRVPTAGGPERLVVDDVREGLWALCDEGVLFVGKPAEDPLRPQSLIFYRFREQSVSFVRELRADQANLRVGFCASRDARFAYLTRTDSLLTDVMLIDDWPFVERQSPSAPIAR